MVPAFAGARGRRLALAVAHDGPQASQPAILRVSGEVPNKLTLSAIDPGSFQRQTICVADEHSTQVEYGGVQFEEILGKAGIPLGKEPTGTNMRVGVIAPAPEGYPVLFSLAEFDPACA